MGQDHLAPAVLAGQQGRCSGLEGDRQGWVGISAPDRDIGPVKRAQPKK